MSLTGLLVRTSNIGAMCARAPPAFSLPGNRTSSFQPLWESNPRPDSYSVGYVAHKTPGSNGSVRNATRLRTQGSCGDVRLGRSSRSEPIR